MNNLTFCNHCAGKVVRSLNEHVDRRGLTFCSEECADGFFSPDNPEPEPVGLKYDLGEE